MTTMELHYQEALTVRSPRVDRIKTTLLRDLAPTMLLTGGVFVAFYAAIPTLLG